MGPIVALLALDRVNAEPLEALMETDLYPSHPFCGSSLDAITRYVVLSCYQYVTESHCSATSPVPYGVCNKNGPDTSRSVQRASSAAARASTNLTWRWTLAVVAAVACSAIQLAVN